MSTAPLTCDINLFHREMARLSRKPAGPPGGRELMRSKGVMNLSSIYEKAEFEMDELPRAEVLNPRIDDQDEHVSIDGTMDAGSREHWGNGSQTASGTNTELPNEENDSLSDYWTSAALLSVGLDHGPGDQATAFPRTPPNQTVDPNYQGSEYDLTNSLPSSSSSYSQDSPPRPSSDPFSYPSQRMEGPQTSALRFNGSLLWRCQCGSSMCGIREKSASVAHTLDRARKCHGYDKEKISNTQSWNNTPERYVRTALAQETLTADSNSSYEPVTSYQLDSAMNLFLLSLKLFKESDAESWSAGAKDDIELVSIHRSTVSSSYPRNTTTTDGGFFSPQLYRSGPHRTSLLQESTSVVVTASPDGTERDRNHAPRRQTWKDRTRGYVLRAAMKIGRGAGSLMGPLKKAAKSVSGGMLRRRTGLLPCDNH